MNLAIICHLVRQQNGQRPRDAIFVERAVASNRYRFFTLPDFAIAASARCCSARIFNRYRD